jgi:hypothetical protein
LISEESIINREARVGIIGMGYVGLPLVILKHANLVVDTRNATAEVQECREKIVKA